MTDTTVPVTGYPVTTNGYTHPYPHYFHVTRPPPPPPTYPNQQRAIFLPRIFSIIIACIIITGTIIFIMWLILRPQTPKFTVQTLTLTNFNVTSNSMISGDFTAALTVRNPNSKIILYYDHVEAAVFYNSISIAMSNVAPFVQGKKNETEVRVSFGSGSGSDSEYFDDLSGINSERASGIVGFNLRLVARVRFKEGAWGSRRRVLRVYCPDLLVRVLTNGTGGSLTGGSKHCRVGL